MRNLPNCTHFSEERRRLYIETLYFIFYYIVTPNNQFLAEVLVRMFQHLPVGTDYLFLAEESGPLISLYLFLAKVFPH